MFPNGDLPAFHTNFTFDNRTFVVHNKTPAYFFRPNYCYKNQTLQADDLDILTKCQPANYFVWGFSSVIVAILLAVQMGWTIGTYLFWLDANLNSTLCRNGRRIRGPFRAASDLVDAMKEVLGGQTCAYADSELAEALK